MTINCNSEYIYCPICESNEYKVIIRAKDATNCKYTYSQGLPQPLVSQVVKCIECGLIYINPRKKMDEITNNYSDTEEYGYSSQSKQRLITFNKKLQLIEKYINRGSIIDIGCASGEFLQAAKDSGWEITGVELNKNLAELSKNRLGDCIFNGVIEDMSVPEKSYDVATLFDVVEHLPQPLIVLKKVHSILKDNGYLIVNYPDISSLSSRIFGKKWWFLMEDHLFYFSKATLKLLLEKAGFKTVIIKSHKQSLELGYLIHLLSSYNLTMSKILSFVAKYTLLEKLVVHYRAGQTTIVARKIDREI